MDMKHAGFCTVCKREAVAVGTKDWTVPFCQQHFVSAVSADFQPKRYDNGKVYLPSEWKQARELGQSC